MKVRVICGEMNSFLDGSISFCGETGSLLFRFNYSHPGLLGASAGFKIIS